MKKHIYFLLTFFISIILLADGDRLGFLSMEQFAFKNISFGFEIDFGNSVTPMIESLGPPEIEVAEKYGWTFSKYSWTGIDLYLLPDTEIIIIAVLTTGESYQTVDGVRVGFTVDDVMKTYGDPRYIGENYAEYIFSDIDETWSLGFHLEDFVVTSIEMSRVD